MTTPPRPLRLLAAPAAVLLAAAPAVAEGPVIVPLTDLREGDLRAIAIAPGVIDAYVPDAPFAPVDEDRSVVDDDSPSAFASASLATTSEWLDLAPDQSSATGFRFTTACMSEAARFVPGPAVVAEAIEAVDVSFEVAEASPEAPVFVIVQSVLEADPVSTVSVRLERGDEILFEALEPGTAVQPIELTEPATLRLVVDVSASVSLSAFTSVTRSASADVTVAVDDVVGAPIADGPFVNPCNGHAYYLVEPSGWDAARLAAVAAGGTLATVDDARENEWIRRRVASGRRLWLGLNDRAVEGTFEWLDGAPLAFEAWADGEPGPDDHVAMDPDTGQWRTLPDDGGDATPTYGLVEIVPDLPGIEGGPYFNPDNGNTYWLYRTSDWFEANRAAAAQGGRLLTINSAAENGWVVSTIQTEVGGRLWTGLNDLAVEGDFRWISGASLTYENFGVGQPNGGEDEFAVAIQSNFSGTWSDLPFDAELTRAVVEIESCPTDVDGDGTTGFADLIGLLKAWGPCGCEPEDFDGNGEVGFDDLVQLVFEWGPC